MTSGRFDNCEANHLRFHTGVQNRGVSTERAERAVYAEARLWLTWGISGSERPF